MTGLTEDKPPVQDAFNSNDMGKKYCFEIGIEAPINSLDDLFEIEVELSQEEHDKMYAAYVEYMWDGDDLSELFRDYLPDLNMKIIGLAEPVAIAKWGEVARLENGARYSICDPREIEEEYEESEDEKEFYEAQKRMQKNCKRQSEYEHDLLFRQHNEGRWTQIRKAGPFEEIFACYRTTGGREAYYSMECKFNRMHIEYCKRYTLKGSKMEIRFYGSKTYGAQLINDYLSKCGREINVRDMTGHYLVYVPAKEDESDIKIILSILDKLESDCSRLRQCKLVQ